MAYAHATTLPRTTGLRAAFDTFLATLAEARRRDRAYRETYAELDRMTDRDLADIGITRFMIADVAAQAAARA